MAERRREIQPPALAALLDLSERPRAENWSLRAALTRYAQPEPRRVSELLECVRRIEFALADHMAMIQRDGEALWAEVQGGGDPEPGAPAFVVALLRAAIEIDRLGDSLAVWAVDRAGERPDAAVDAVTADVTQRLGDLGVPRQEGPPVPPSRRRG